MQRLRPLPWLQAVTATFARAGGFYPGTSAAIMCVFPWRAGLDSRIWLAARSVGGERRATMCASTPLGDAPAIDGVRQSC